MNVLKHTPTFAVVMFLSWNTGYWKRHWRFSDGLMQVLAKHWTMLTCDVRGITNRGSTEFDLEDNDIFVATFGRSGTMFLMNLLHQLRTGGDEEFEAVEFLGRFFVPMSGLSRERLNWPQWEAPPRLFFTHGLPQQTPDAKYVIFIQRDPEKILASWYTFQMQMYGFQNVSLEDYYFNCIRKHCVWPQDSILHNLQQWWVKAQSSSLLWLRFEDFKKSDIGTYALATRIQSYLGDITKMQRNISAVFDKIMYSFGKQHPEQFNLHAYVDYLDEAIDQCAPHRSDLVTKRHYRGIKTVHQLKLNIRPTERVIRHMRDAWQRIIYPVTGHESYAEMLTSCRNSVE